MIWLASFPRSGNTFFRNVLFEVYGIESSTYHKDPKRSLDPDFDTYPVIKTHLLPHQLPQFSDRKIVYLIRDGRDAVVSLARHRSDIVEPGSDFENNLLECILAKNGSHFGGWSENVSQWSAKADIIIRFEDLIKDPIKEVEKLRGLLRLPPPNKAKLPSFQDLKFGSPKYGGNSQNLDDKDIAKKNFRKGKIGSYVNEMPVSIHELFLHQHGQTLKEFGYISSLPPDRPQIRLLIEGSKYFNPSQDGVSRYTSNLIEHLPQVLKYQNHWHIDIIHKNKIITLKNAMDARQVNDKSVMTLEYGYEDKLLEIKEQVKRVLPKAIYSPLRSLYIKGPWRILLKKLKSQVSSSRIKSIQKDISKTQTPYDIIHATVPQGLIDIEKLEGKKVVTIHDITHSKTQDFHTAENIQETHSGFELAVRMDAHVICVSEHTLADLKKAYPDLAKNGETILEGVNPDKFHPRLRDREHYDELMKYNLPEGDFILCLSTLEPRKNLKRTIAAFLQLRQHHPTLDISLVIAGKKGWKLSEVIPGDLPENSKIVFTGFIDEADLPLLMARAKVFSYVSLYEGFGLPPLEAMSSGTPVIYGRNSSMIEIIADAGIGVDAESIDEIEKAMYTALTNDELWLRLQKDGRERSNRFTWLKMAFQTALFYESILKKA